MNRYYIIQTCAHDNERVLPYTEHGFDTRHKARHYLAKTGESWCRIERR